jgi:hypothetical protein
MVLYTNYEDTTLQRDLSSVEQWIRARPRTVLCTLDGTCIGGRVRDIVDCLTDPFNIGTGSYFSRRYENDIQNWGESMLWPDTEGRFFASVSKHGPTFVRRQNYVFLNQNAPPVLCYDTALAKSKLWSLILYTNPPTRELKTLLLDAMCLHYFKTKPRYVFFYLLLAFNFVLFLRWTILTL